MALRSTARITLVLASLAAALSGLLVSCLAQGPKAAAPGKPVGEIHAAKPSVIFGFSPSWTDEAFPPKNYDYASLTHIGRSFLLPHPDGRITETSGFWNEDLERQAHAHGIKLLAAIGGAAPDASHWLTMARDPAARERFFTELDALLTQHHYDGMDIDWEPSAQSDPDQATFTEFMQALRKRFPARVITTSLGVGDWSGRHISWKQVAESVDYINLMTYVFAGPWTHRSAHNANLGLSSLPGGDDTLSVRKGVEDVIHKYGVPANKLNVGLAFYGIQFSTDHLGQPFPDPSRYKGEEVSYGAVQRLLKSGKYEEKWDKGGIVPYLERHGGGHTVSYDDERSIAEKCAFASEIGAAGVMIWYLGGDAVRGEPVLQHALAKTYGLPVTAPSLQTLQETYAARSAEVERLQTEIDRERGELRQRSAQANDKLERTTVPMMFPSPAADPASLDQQIAQVDDVLGKLELERAEVQRALTALPAIRGKAIPWSGASLLFADFEGDMTHSLGGSWSASFDKNGLGTVFNPNPPAWSGEGKNGAKAWHAWGHFGKSRAPWPYAALVADFAATDFEPVQSIRFWAKGDGKRYGLSLQRSSVHDYAFPISVFEAPKDWTQIELKTQDFKQPDWGQKINGPYTDAIGLAFAPGPQFDDEDYDLWIDDVELLKKP